MEYGILIAIQEGETFQVVSAVASLDEAREMAVNYIQHGPDFDCVPADRFVIQRRGYNGFYTTTDEFSL